MNYRAQIEKCLYIVMIANFKKLLTNYLFGHSNKNIRKLY